MTEVDSLTALRQRFKEAIKSSQTTSHTGVEARKKFEQRRELNIEKLGEESIYSLIPKNIDSTKLLAGAMNALQRNDIKTLKDLARKDEKQLINLGGIGDERMNLIRPLRQLAIVRRFERTPSE